MIAIILLALSAIIYAKDPKSQRAATLETLGTRVAGIVMALMVLVWLWSMHVNAMVASTREPIQLYWTTLESKLSTLWMVLILI